MATIRGWEQTGARHTEGDGSKAKLPSNRALEEAYAQLELSEMRFRDLYDRAPDMYHTLDLTGKFVEFNPKHTEVLGYSHEELINNHISAIMPEEMIPELESGFQELMANGTLQGKEIALKKKDGSLMTVEVHAMRFDGPDGEPQEVRCIMRDITQRKMLEAQLSQSQKMESIGRLAGGIAHDFNNLLTAISGYTQLAMAAPDKIDGVKKYLGQVKEASDRASNLTKQLLAFSRRQIIAPKVININDVVVDMEQLLNRLVTENIEVSTRLSPDIGQVNIDPTQVEQVLVNLVVNARDAMPEGGSLVISTRNESVSARQARLHPDLSAGEYVALAVTDSGEGIDEAIQARIFEPFFTTKEEGKGTGLGLSMCYGIMKQNNGHICVQSKPGQGSRFRILIPRVDDAPVSIEHGAERNEAVIGTEAILLVEDDPLVRGLGAEVLRQHGYLVLEATDGSNAVTVSQNHGGTIHLMLTDVIMPNMAVKDLTDKIKGSRPEIKVLFTSGYANDEVVRQGVLESEMEFIEKPYSPTDLLQKVRQVLDS